MLSVPGFAPQVRYIQIAPEQLTIRVPRADFTLVEAADIAIEQSPKSRPVVAAVRSAGWHGQCAAAQSICPSAQHREPL